MTSAGRELAKGGRLSQYVAPARFCVQLPVLAVIAGALAGCASGGGQDLASTAFASPGKFSLYTCADLQRTYKTTKEREQELVQMMGLAAQSTGGEFINAIAYRSDHARVRSELRLLTEAANEKHCTIENK